MVYQTLEERTKRVIPNAWLFADCMRLKFIGPLRNARTGPVHQVELDLDFLPPEDLYSFARSLRLLSERIEREAEHQMERETQRGLF